MTVITILAVLIAVVSAEVLDFSSEPISNTPTWSWECQDRQCNRVQTSTIHSPRSLSVCKLTCGEFGALWPKPTGTLELGSEVVAIDFNNIVFTFTAPQDTRLQTLLGGAKDIFLENLNKLLVNHTNRNEESTDNQYRLNVTVSVESPETKLTLSTNESYILVVEDRGDQVLATIQAPTFFGARHGLETLFQLIDYNDYTNELVIVDAARINDKPSYPHRGLSIDTSRNFISLEAIKRTISALALNKLNVLHWHITDTHSWPIESQKVPQMTQWGAYSPEKIYRAADVRDIVEYARVRGVRVIPELDAPAHLGNGFQWGPEKGLGTLAVCVNQEPWQKLCVEPPCGQLNPLNPHVYDLLETFYEEWLGMFDSDVFHMGGDEVSISCWNASKEITDEFEADQRNRTDENFVRLWSDFQNTAVDRLDLASRRHSIQPQPIIIWTSHLTEKGTQYLNPDRYIIQIWTKGDDKAIAKLANEGFRLIMSNYDALYFDCGFGAWVGEGNNWCSPYIGWQKVYDNDPRRILLNLNVTQEIADNVSLGAEAALWTEQADDAVLDSRYWPRAAALAERLWSAPEESWRSAEVRMIHNRQRMFKLGIAADRLQPQWCHQNEGLCYL